MTTHFHDLTSAFDVGAWTSNGSCSASMLRHPCPLAFYVCSGSCGPREDRCPASRGRAAGTGFSSQGPCSGLLASKGEVSVGVASPIIMVESCQMAITPVPQFRRRVKPLGLPSDTRCSGAVDVLYSSPRFPDQPVPTKDSFLDSSSSRRSIPKPPLASTAPSVGIWR